MAYALFFYLMLALIFTMMYCFIKIVWHIFDRVKTDILLERIQDKNDLLYMDFKDFINVTAEVLKRKGYKVRATNRCGEDNNGLEIDGLQFAEVFKIGVNRLMEVESAMKLAWCMRINSIHRGQIITLGDFKKNTRAFCHMHVISCINGDQFLAMCKEVQRSNAVPDLIK